MPARGNIPILEMDERLTSMDPENSTLKPNCTD